VPARMPASKSSSRVSSGSRLVSGAEVGVGFGAFATGGGVTAAGLKGVQAPAHKGIDPP
jgi:hypothetical protein